MSVVFSSRLSSEGFRSLLVSRRKWFRNQARWWVDRFPSLVVALRPAWRLLNRSDIEISNRFPLFAPNSSGSARARAQATIRSVNETFPFIGRLLDSIGRNQLVANVITAEQFCLVRESMAEAIKLKEELEACGSDKATTHDYYYIYGPILKNRALVTAVLEIGVGTNNESMLSNMGKNGKPGASLRAFRDFLPNARIYGADLDKEILFSEDRIQTCFLDQTDLGSFHELGSKVGSEFDLIIDDGLHSPNANIASLIFAIDNLKEGGWFVVEDIPRSAVPVWQVIAALLPAHFKTYLISCRRQFVFSVERVN
jgi:hypothetical protein